MSGPTTPYRRFTSDGVSLRKGLAMRCLLGVAVGVFFSGLGLTPFGPCAGAVAGDRTDASSSRQPCNGQHVPIYRTWSVAAWMCRLIPGAPTGCALPCGSAACPCLIPPGVLLFIPGGPGAGIAKGDNSTAQRVDEFRRRWDVVSFDPRGIERSSPIRCSPDRAALAAPSKPPYHLAARR
jgi:pimeloyl-ACP methyl ester carboxylesterase